MAKMCKNVDTDLALCNNGPTWNTKTGNTALIQRYSLFNESRGGL